MFVTKTELFRLLEWERQNTFEARNDHHEMQRKAIGVAMKYVMDPGSNASMHAAMTEMLAALTICKIHDAAIKEVTVDQIGNITPK